jgi:tetratricopeptide (TPR) repeat protein
MKPRTASVALALAAISSSACRAVRSDQTIDGGAAGSGEASMQPTGESSVVFRGKDGKVLTRADLARANGSVDWEVVSGALVPAEARKLHEQGRRAGGGGRPEEALELFQRSAHLAPKWPYPPYDAAYTHLLAGNDARALELYSHALELAPRGFYTAITAVHYLRLEAAKRLPRGTYRAYLALEGTASPQQRRDGLEALTKSAPGFAPAWKDLALLTDDPAQRIATLDEGLAREPDAETRGFLLLNKALVFANTRRKEEAKAILGELATQADQPPDVHELALFSLANVAKP